MRRISHRTKQNSVMKFLVIQDPKAPQLPNPKPITDTRTTVILMNEKKASSLKASAHHRLCGILPGPQILFTWTGGL
jgi:hypothetical protein